MLEYAPLAAREAIAAGAHHQALAMFETVINDADRLPLQERATLLDDYSWELGIGQRFAESVGFAERAIQLRERIGDPVALAETLLRISRSYYLAGDPEAALAAMDRADELTAGSPDGGATISTYRGMIVTLTRRDHVPEELERALELALAAGRTDLAALCLNYLGVIHTYAADPRGIEMIRQSLTDALRNDDHEPTACAYTSLASVLLREGRLDELEPVLADALRFTREHGIWLHTYDLEANHAQLRLRQGRWPEAETTLRRLLEARKEAGMLAVHSSPVLARLLARRGDMEQAQALLTTSWRQAWDQQSFNGILYATVSGAEFAWLSGNREWAEIVHKAASEQTGQAGLNHVLGETMYYLWRAGAPVELFDGCSERYAAALRGDWESATNLTDDPYERAVFQSGSADPKAISQALRTFDALGAISAAELAIRELARLGSHPPRRVDAKSTSPGALTQRQLDVLRLLAEGRTNAGIATELVLSTRTVDHHVAAILLRLGVGTRHQAIEAAKIRGLLTYSE